MNTGLILTLLPLLLASTLYGKIDVYVVHSREQMAVDYYESVEQFCDVFSQGGGDTAIPIQQAFGVLYKKLVEDVWQAQEELPPLLVLKNNLKIRDYYVFYMEHERMDHSVWLVMDRRGHMVFCFNWFHGSGPAAPRLFAASTQTLWPRNPTWKDLECHEQGDEVWIYRKDRKTGAKRLNLFFKGNVAVYVEEDMTSPFHDWGMEYLKPTIKQEELVPVLREFVDIQTGRARAVHAERDILNLLPRARQMRYEYLYKTEFYPNNPPKPEAPDTSALPDFDGIRGRLAQLLDFPDPAGYRYTKDSGPHPQRRTHCRRTWLQGLGYRNAVRWDGGNAVIAGRLYLNREDRAPVWLMVAQCGTRELALEGLARMRLWQGKLEKELSLRAVGRWKEEAPDPDPDQVAARTCTSNRLVGDYALHLKGMLDKFGKVSKEGRYAGIFFVRGTTAVCVVSEDPFRNMLPVAKRLDEELKKMHSLGDEKREPFRWKPDKDKDNIFNKYMKSKGVPKLETDGKNPWDDEKEADEDDL